jgi:hypothetical protein
MTYAKMLQSLAEWVSDAAIRRNILVDTPTRLLAFACGRARGRKGAQCRAHAALREPSVR